MKGRRLELRLLQVMRESVVLTDADLEIGPRILYANDAFWQMTGYEPGELLGRTPRVLQGPQTDRAMLRSLRKSLLNGDPFEGTTINYRKDGSSYHVRWYIEPIRDAMGTIEFFAAVQRDISLDIKKEETLSAVLSAVEASAVGLLFVEADGRIVRTNYAATRMLRLSEQRSENLRVAEIVESAKKIERPGGGRFRLELDNDDGERRSLELRRLGDTNQEVIWMVTDETERRRLEALANAINLVEQTGYVFAGIRHELGNPINSVRTALSVLIKHGESFGEERRSEYYSRMLKELDRVSFLLRSLRAYNEHESQQLGVFDVATVLKEFSKVALDQPQTAPAVEFSGLDRQTKVIGDPRGVYQVLLNLLKNASDAVCDVEEPIVRIELSQTGSQARIDVTDNGAGMTPVQLERLGRPFLTTKAHGTGLGVAVSQQILARMNGLLEFESKVGHGTTASILLSLHSR